MLGFPGRHEGRQVQRFRVSALCHQRRQSVCHHAKAFCVCASEAHRYLSDSWTVSNTRLTLPKDEDTPFTSETNLNELGTVHVKCYRITVFPVEETEQERSKDLERFNWGAVNEKTKKAGTHRVQCVVNLFLCQATLLRSDTD